MRNQIPEEMDPFDRVVYEIDRTESVPERHLSLQIDGDIAAMIRAARDSGQTASVTIKITAKLKGDMVEFSGTSAAKLPKRATGVVRLFADDDGNLFDHNPNHARSALPGVDVKTPPRKHAVEVPINSKEKK